MAHTIDFNMYSETTIYSYAILCTQLWNEMEQRIHIGMPESGSSREKEFNSNREQLRQRIQNVISRRQDGEEEESIPFIDALLQSGVPEEQVL